MKSIRAWGLLSLLFSVFVTLVACGGGGGGGGDVAVPPDDSDGDGIADPVDQCPGTLAGVAVDGVGCPKSSAEFLDIAFNDGGEGTTEGKEILDGLGNAYAIKKGTRNLYSLGMKQDVPNTKVTEQNDLRVSDIKKGIVFLSSVAPRRVGSAGTDTNNLPPPGSGESGKVAVLAWQDGEQLKFININSDLEVQQGPNVLPGNPRPPQGGPDSSIPVDDGNNSPESAVGIEVDGTPATGAGITVSNTNDPNDYYQFVAPGSEPYKIELTFKNADLDLVLYRADLSPIEHKQSTSGTEETIQSSLQAGQSYYVRVYAFDTAGLAAPYSLAVKQDTDRDPDGDGSFATARDISGEPTRADSVSEKDDHSDYSRFKAEASTTHVVELIDFAGAALDLELFEADQSLAGGSKQYDGGYIRIEKDLLAGQTYYIRVKANSGASTYTLKRTANPKPVDDNNSCEDADPIAELGTKSSDVNSSNDENDFWKFTATRSMHNYTFKLSFDSQDLNLYLYDASDSSKSIASATTEQSPESFAEELQQGKSYCVRVKARNTTSVQGYTLNISAEPIGPEPPTDNDNSFEKATLLDDPVNKRSKVNNYNDPDDYYKFTPVNDCSKYTIGIDNSELKLKLYDSQRRLIKETIGGNIEEELTRGLLYYVLVNAHQTSAAAEEDYVLSIRSTRLDDGDNSVKTAKSIADSGTEGSGRLSTTCDVQDWRRFTATRTGQYTLRLDNPGLGLYVFYRGELIHPVHGEPGQTVQVNLVAEREYHVEIVTNESAAGEEPYTLTIEQPVKLAPCEASDRYMERQSGNKFYASGSVASVGDNEDPNYNETSNDAFKFRAPATGEYTFEMVFGMANNICESFSVDLDMLLYKFPRYKIGEQVEQDRRGDCIPEKFVERLEKDVEYCVRVGGFKTNGRTVSYELQVYPNPILVASD